MESLHEYKDASRAKIVINECTRLASNASLEQSSCTPASDSTYAIKLSLIVVSSNRASAVH